MAEPARAAQEVIDLTEDVSDASEDQEERVYEIEPGWFRKQAEKRAREQERQERKLEREAREWLRYSETEEFRAKIGRLALRPLPVDPTLSSEPSDAASPCTDPVPKSVPVPASTNPAAVLSLEPASKPTPEPTPTPPPMLSSESAPKPTPTPTPVLTPTLPSEPAPKSTPKATPGPTPTLSSEPVPEPTPAPTSMLLPEPPSMPASADPTVPKAVPLPPSMVAPVRASMQPPNAVHAPAPTNASADTNNLRHAVFDARIASRKEPPCKQRLFDEETTVLGPPSALAQRALAEMRASAEMRVATVRDGIEFIAKKRECVFNRPRNTLSLPQAHAKKTYSQGKKKLAQTKALTKSRKVRMEKARVPHEGRPSSQEGKTTRPAPSPTFSRRFHHARWPPKVASIRQHFNPLDVTFAYESPFGGMCGCDSPCRKHTCRNGILGIICAPNCCVYAGQCGNSLTEIENVELVHRDQTPDLAVRATSPIERGMVIGQYLGKVLVERDDDDDFEDDDNSFLAPTLNSGYRYQFTRDSCSHPHAKIIIDAEDYGCITRFMNHSCNATARFHEVRNGTEHTVVVAAERDIAPGEEITINYGTNIWFICHCKEPSCAHRYLRRIVEE